MEEIISNIGKLKYKLKFAHIKFQSSIGKRSAKNKDGKIKAKDLVNTCANVSFKGCPKYHFKRFIQTNGFP